MEPSTTHGRDAVRRWASTFGAGIVLFAVIFALAGATPELWVDHSGRKATSIRWRTSVGLADTALLLLATSLVIGPARVLRGRRPARHLPVRRSIAVVGAVFAAGHLVVGLSVHGDLRTPWRSFVSGLPSRSAPLPIPWSFLVLANWIGLAVLAGLVLLAAISNAPALRRLGPRRWKRLQRLAYPVFGLVALHLVLYQKVEQRWLPHQAMVLAVVTTVVVAQLAAAVVVRRRAAGSGRAPDLADQTTDVRTPADAGTAG